MIDLPALFRFGFLRWKAGVTVGRIPSNLGSAVVKRVLGVVVLKVGSQGCDLTGLGVSGSGRGLGVGVVCSRSNIGGLRVLARFACTNLGLFEGRRGGPVSSPIE